MAASMKVTEINSGSKKTLVSAKSGVEIPSRAHTGQVEAPLSGVLLTATARGSGVPWWVWSRFIPAWVNSTTRRIKPANTLEMPLLFTSQI
jgi:hypothetical protein